MVKTKKEPKELGESKSEEVEEKKEIEAGEEIEEGKTEEKKEPEKKVELEEKEEVAEADEVDSPTRAELNEVLEEDEDSDRKDPDKKTKESAESVEKKSLQEEEVEEESFDSLDEDEVEKPSWWQNNKKFFFIGFSLLVFLGVVGGGIFVYKKAMSEKGSSGEPTLVELPSPRVTEATAEPTATSTPAPELERGDLKLQVLNGSGIAGTAGAAKEFLEELGYLEIQVGNADSYDFQEAEISIKEEKEDYLELLVTDLESEYAVSSESAFLDEESEFDAVVIVGKG